MAFVLFLPCVLVGQQQRTPDQGVPDAPTPQAPNSLGNLTSGVTPGKGTSQSTASDTEPTSSQAPPSPPAGADQVQQAPPVVPEPGQLQRNLVTFRTTVNFVNLPVTVLDKKHNQVAGLTFRDFRVYENNQLQAIRLFSADQAAEWGMIGQVVTADDFEAEVDAGHICMGTDQRANKAMLESLGKLSFKVIESHVK